MTTTPDQSAPSGDSEALSLVVIHTSDDLGWAVAARRQEEGDRYFAQVERVRSIIEGIPADTDEAGLMLAIERIGDVVGAAHNGSSSSP